MCGSAAYWGKLCEQRDWAKERSPENSEDAASPVRKMGQLHILRILFRKK